MTPCMIPFFLLGLCQSKIPALRRDGEVNLLKAHDLAPEKPDPFYALGELFKAEKLTNRAEGYFKKAADLSNDTNSFGRFKKKS